MYKTIQTLQKHCKKAVIYEFIRQIIANKGDVESFLSTYQNQKTFLPDSNSSAFWDKQFENKISISNKSPDLFPMEKWRIKLVSRLLSCKSKTLNLGCGVGKLEYEMMRKCRVAINWISTDITKSTLDRLKNIYPRIEFIRSTLEELPFRDKTFDQVVALEVLEHIKPSATLDVLFEINRVLKTNATFVVSVPINEGLEHILPLNPNSHMRIYSLKVLELELLHSGFFIKRVYQASAFKSLFRIKHIINKLITLRKSNNVVVFATKVRDI